MGADRPATSEVSERVFDREGREVLRAGHGTALLVVEKHLGSVYLRWGGVGQEFIVGLDPAEALALSVALGSDDGATDA